MADLLIALLQNYAAAAALFPVGAADSEEAARELPEPMLPGNWDSATGACLRDESLSSAMVQVQASSMRDVRWAPACYAAVPVYHRQGVPDADEQERQGTHVCLDPVC